MNRHRSGRAILALATCLVTSQAAAQAPPLLSPSGTLAASAALRSSAVELSVTLSQAAILVPLGYHADRGWYLLGSIASLPVRNAGPQTVRYPRRLGRLEVPTGTSEGSFPNVPDPRLGCAAARGVLDARTGACGFGGSEHFGPVVDVAIGPADYRGALVRLAPGISATLVDSALRAASAMPAADGLAHLARALAQSDSTTAWALVRIPHAR